MTQIQSRRLARSRLLVPLLVIALTTGLALGGKPGGGGGGTVPPGRIYYSWATEVIYPGSGFPSGGESLGFWSMNADGSDKQLLPYQPNLYWSARLSHQLHQGHRWFLEFRGDATFHGLFAVRDDGDPDYVVPLVDTSAYSTSHYRWSQDDSLISIAARPRIPDAVAHIYAAFIAFDPETGLPELATPLVAVVDGDQPGFSDIRNHDWSPDGQQIVYQQEPNPGPSSVKIVDLATGTTRLLAADSYQPAWSPDGTRIAYKLFDDGLHAINPDGSGLLKITSGRSDYRPTWSPDSQHVVFSQLVIKRSKGGGTKEGADILRVPATGGTSVNLTGDIAGDADVTYWR